MKYSLMSMPFVGLLKTEKPNFIDIMQAKRAGLDMDEDAITFADIRAYYAEKGIPFQERTMEFEDLVRIAKEAGYSGVDCMNFVLELPASAVKTILEKHGMQLSSYNIIARFNNAASRAEIDYAVENYVKPGIDYAVEAGAEAVLIMPTHILQAPEISRENAYENIIYGLRRCAAYAAERGIPLTTETLHSIQVPYCSNGEILRVLEAVPELAYVHDTGNLLPSLEKAEEAIDLFRDKLVGLHMKDFLYGEQPNMNLCTNGKYLQPVPYGSGMVDFGMIFKKLAAWDYAGWIAFEGTTRGADPVSGAVEDLTFFKSLEQ